MTIGGKNVKIIVKGDLVTFIINDESVTMTKDEWSKLIAVPEVY